MAGRNIARPTQRALDLAASPAGRALAKKLGVEAQVNATLNRYKKAQSGTELTLRRLLERKLQLESIKRKK